MSRTTRSNIAPSATATATPPPASAPSTGVGLSGIPVVNVNNNCATGSSALYLAKKFIEGGLADCALALGFEKMEKGSLGVKYTDRASPMGKFFSKMNKLRGVDRKKPGAPQMFGNAGREYMERYGVKAESFARIGEKKSPPLGQQPLLAVPRHLHPAGDPRRPHGLGAPHEAAVLPHLRRRRRRGAGERAFREGARTRGQGRRDQSQWR